MTHGRAQGGIGEHDPNLQLMRRTLDAFLAGDMPTLAQVFSKDVVWRVPGKSFLAKDYRGRRRSSASSGAWWN